MIFVNLLIYRVRVIHSLHFIFLSPWVLLLPGKGLAFHSTCRSWSAWAPGFGGGEGWWKEMRLGFSLQTKETDISPSVCFSRGFMFLEKGWNSGPVNKRVVLTALRIPSSTAPLSKSNYFPHSSLTQPRRACEAGLRANSAQEIQGALAWLSLLERKVQVKRDATPWGRGERMWRHLQECRAHAGVLAPTNFLFKRAR